MRPERERAGSEGPVKTRLWIVALLGLLILGRAVAVTLTPEDEALFRAIDQKNVEQVRAMLDAGAGANAEGERGQTPLCAAAIYEEKEIVELLLSRGANVNRVPSRGSTTALGTAASYGHPELVRLLLRHGADPNLPDADGLTPLEQAGIIRGWHGEAVIELLAHGARIPKPPADSRRESVFEAAASSCDGSALVALFEKGVTQDDLPAKALAHCSPETFAKIMAAGFDLNRHDTKGRTVLQEATRNGREQVVRLLEMGADPNLATPEGETPLMLAVGENPERERWEVVKALLEHHADPSLQDAQGRTALHRAAAARVRRTISLLALAGADPGVPDREGHTPGGLYWKRMVGPKPTFREGGAGLRRVYFALPGDVGPCGAPRRQPALPVLAECVSNVRERSLWVSISWAPKGATLESVAPGEELTVSEAAWQGRTIPIGRYMPAGQTLGQTWDPEVWIAVVPMLERPLLVRVWTPREYGVEAGWTLRGILGSLRQPSPKDQFLSLGLGRIATVLGCSLGLLALLAAAALWLIQKLWPSLRPLTRLTPGRRRGRPGG